MEAQTAGPFFVCHTLDSYPVKVEVQVKVQTQNHGEQIFQGVGSAQRDDDIDVPYGGIVYIYNSTHVVLFVPKDTQAHWNSDKGTLSYTGKILFYIMFEVSQIIIFCKAWGYILSATCSQKLLKIPQSVNTAFVDVQN
jgi:hypothetical protein